MPAWTRHVRILVRADALLARAALDTLLVRSALVYAGLSALVLGFIMLDVAAWLALRPALGDGLAALLVGSVDVAVALALLLQARRGGSSAELAMAHDVHRLAVDALLDDLEAARGAHGTLDSAVRGIVLPIVLALLRRRRRTRAAGAPAEAPAEAPGD